jgi:predicted helicase
MANRKRNTSLGIDHPAIAQYYGTLAEYEDQRVHHEGAVSTAFENLLTTLSKQRGWVFIPLLAVVGKRIVPDGTIRDGNGLPRAYWEAKDTDDDLDVEIAKKIEKGYPLSNIIFEDTREAVLYQGGAEIKRFDLSNSTELVELLTRFFAYVEPDIEGFEAAVEEFKGRVPDLATGLLRKIREAQKNNSKFVVAFGEFYELCKNAIDPNTPKKDVEEMLVQHLLTERLFRTIFDNPEFSQRNVIANEVDKVIATLIGKSFSSVVYLKSLDSFYVAIENAARTLPDFSDKQYFLDTVYERFFRGYSTRLADTHGIVYTPQPIVDFMSASIVRVLQDHFEKNLGTPDVKVLDPCTGTGNFAVNLLRRVPKRNVKDFYAKQLFANEIMLMAYYIASLNVEHAFYEITQDYEPFEGLCFVDTLDIADRVQKGLAFINEKNSERVERQKKAEITVIVGNPPYNMGQKNENEDNKNRLYPEIDRRIRETYSKDSTATLKNKLYDPYVRFFRWAIDRLEKRPGIVCFVSNNSFVDHEAFDGMQKHLLDDFTRIYHIDLHGDVNRDRTLSGTQHNVFGIQVGVGITIAVRETGHRDDDHSLYYHRVPERWTRNQKLGWLAELKDLSKVPWEVLPPHKWLELETAEAYRKMMPLGTKEAKKVDSPNAPAVFRSFTVGVLTARDEVAYDFNKATLEARVEQFIADYNAEVDRYRRASKTNKKINVNRFVDQKLKWTDRLKKALVAGHEAGTSPERYRRSLWRPFCKKWLYFDRMLNERVYLTPELFPTEEVESKNLVICCTSHRQMPFSCMVTNCLPNEAVGGRNGQCLGLYGFSKDGTVQADNITDWSLTQFRDHYDDKSISKRQIFSYVYAMLHHPDLRTRFAANLRRGIPRIPLAKDFLTCARIGEQLIDLHVGYETVDPFELKWVESDDFPLSTKVTDRMVLDKEAGTIVVNNSLTLEGIPKDAFEYVLGTRSALDWVVDQYTYVEDDDGNVLSDCNDPDDTDYVVNLIQRVVTVSIETLSLIAKLPEEIEFVGPTGTVMSTDTIEEDDLVDVEP